MAEAQLQTMTGITRPLTTGVTLPSLSPLAGRKLKPTIAVGDVVEGLQTFGYDVGWDDGNLQVTPPSSTHPPPSAPATCTLETFLGGMHKDRSLGLGRSGRPRVASSVTFTPARSQAHGSGSNKASPRHAASSSHRPRTSSSTPASPAGRPTLHHCHSQHQHPHHLSHTQGPSADPPLMPPGTSRFNSFNHLNSSNHLNSTNHLPSPSSRLSPTPQTSLLTPHTHQTTSTTSPPLKLPPQTLTPPHTPNFGGHTSPSTHISAPMNGTSGWSGGWSEGQDGGNGKAWGNSSQSNGATTQTAGSPQYGNGTMGPYGNGGTAASTSGGLPSYGVMSQGGVNGGATHAQGVPAPAPSAAAATQALHGTQPEGIQPFTVGDVPPSLLGNSSLARHRRLAQSVDSLQSLKLSSSAKGIHTTNLQALFEPQWAPSFNSTTPIIPQGPLLQPRTASQQPSDGAQGSRDGWDGATQGAHQTGADGRWLPHESRVGEGAEQLGQRGQSKVAASMPLVDIQEGAVASLAASKQAAANGEVHTAQRPFTARVAGARPRFAHPMASFKPSRGHAFLVFQNIDKDKNGKVTMTELEEAGLALGFSLEQIQRLFSRMDKGNRGFLKATDWGDPEFLKVVEFFSLMYMQKFMGLPTQTSTPEQVGKYWASQELRQVKTLPAALSMARTNAVMRASHAAAAIDFILNCFRFIDTEQKGHINMDGLRDGFAALGVHVTDEVARQIMSKCGADGSGINYYDGVHRLFGNNNVF